MMPPGLVGLALAVALGAAPVTPRGAVQGALDAAIAEDGARAEVVAIEGAPPAGCAVGRAELPRVPRASGRTAVRLLGVDAAHGPCQAWVWARIRVSGPTLVTTRDVAEGAPLEGAVAVAVRELRPGAARLSSLPEGARAVRRVPAGVALAPPMFRVGPAPGEGVAVALRAGALLVEQRGTAVACARGRACALLPSGRRIEGTWHDGRIMVEPP